ncbi:MAG: hypothetical protein K5989_03190 [Lachnospiraceae bacterium]|nr:hypothetical protein [Lachnospiraceae bacterium]
MGTRFYVEAARLRAASGEIEEEGSLVRKIGSEVLQLSGELSHMRGEGIPTVCSVLKELGESTLREGSCLKGLSYSTMLISRDYSSTENDIVSNGERSRLTYPNHTVSAIHWKPGELKLASHILDMIG